MYGIMFIHIKSEKLLVYTGLHSIQRAFTQVSNNVLFILILFKVGTLPAS